MKEDWNTLFEVIGFALAAFFTVIAIAIFVADRKEKILAAYGTFARHARDHWKLALGLAAALGIFTGAAWAMLNAVPRIVALNFDSFLAKTLMFLLLTATYLVIFVLAIAAFRFMRGHWSKGEHITFREACREECKTFGKKVLDENGIDKNNNRRWGYLVVMTLITLIIALDHLGSPILWDGVGKIPADLISPSGRQSIANGWTFFMYGNCPPKAASAPIVAAGPTWFWWEAFMLFATMTVIYFFIAFWDESCAALKKGWGIFRERFEEHKEKIAAQKAESEAKAKEAAEKEKTDTQKAEVKTQGVSVTSESKPGESGPTIIVNPQSESKGSSFGWGSFFTAGLAAEIAAGMLHEFLEHREHRLRRAT